MVERQGVAREIFGSAFLRSLAPKWTLVSRRRATIVFLLASKQTMTDARSEKLDYKFPSGLDWPMATLGLRASLLARRVGVDLETWE